MSWRPRARGRLDRHEAWRMARVGPGEVARLERDLARRLDAEAIAQPSARVGLVRTLEALAVPRGAEIVVSGFNYPPLIERFVAAGWTPVPVDVAEGQTSPSPDAIDAALGRRTGAIVATHAFGRPAPMAAYRRIADAAGVPLVGDAAQALGAEVGVHADATVYSFGPTKPLAAWGGGAVTTRDPALARRLRARVDRTTRSRWLRGVAFEVASRFGAPLLALPVNWDRWATEREGELRRRPWQDGAMDAACAALVRGRLRALTAITAARRAAHARATAELRARGVTVLDDAPGGIGFGVLALSDRPAELVRAMRRRGRDAARGELRAIGGLPRARRLERRLVRVPTR